MSFYRPCWLTPSNGQTLDLRDLSPPFAIGADWSPSGGKNLLHELKVAWLYGRETGAGPTLGFEALARAVTIDAARVAKCEPWLGSLAPNTFADLIVLRRRFEDPYENLVRATERDVQLVCIDGEPRYGDAQTLAAFVTNLTNAEYLAIHGETMVLNLDQPSSPPQGLTLNQAQMRLTAVISDLRNNKQLQRFENSDAGPAFDIEFDMQSTRQPEPMDGFAPMDLKKLAPLESVLLDSLTVASDLPMLEAMQAT